GWETGTVCSELQRILKEGWIKPCRTLELGCGTGTNAVFLAAQGFEVTAVDISRQAVEQAQTWASRAGVSILFRQGDILELTDLGAPYSFVLDRGTYHTLR